MNEWKKGRIKARKSGKARKKRMERRERNEWKEEKEKTVGTKELRPSNYMQEKESEWESELQKNKGGREGERKKKLREKEQNSMHLNCTVEGNVQREREREETSLFKLTNHIPECLVLLRKILRTESMFSLRQRERERNFSVSCVWSSMVHFFGFQSLTTRN